MAIKMNRENTEQILEDWNIKGLTLEQQVIKIFEKVRDIPFGSIGSRDPMDVYQANKGTCSGKNFLLRELYRAIGLKTKDMICLQRWKDLTWFPDDRYQTVDFPVDLEKMLQSKEIIDFHNYVLVYLNNNWLQVDVTIDLPLTELGFYTTKNWEGKSDMPLCFVGTHKVWDCGDKGDEKKTELTAKLPENIRKDRKNFLKAITSWIDEWRQTRG